MKKSFGLLISLLLISLSLFSQNKKFGVELSKIKQQKHHFELDIRNIFNGLGGATLLYKKRRNKDLENDDEALKLLRLTASLNSSVNFDSNINDFTTLLNDPIDVTSIGFGIGVEKQKMNKHFVHYFGI